MFFIPSHPGSTNSSLRTGVWRDDGRGLGNAQNDNNDDGNGGGAQVNDHKEEDEDEMRKTKRLKLRDFQKNWKKIAQLFRLKINVFQLLSAR